jgi:hypothetical protein
MLRRLAIAALALALAPLAAPAAEQSARTFSDSAFGQTQDDARRNALDKGRAKVQQYLDENFPGLHDLNWSPTADYLEHIGAVRVDKPMEVELTDLGKGYEAVYRVDLTDPKLAAMQERVNEAQRKALEPVVSERHFLVGRVLAAFVAVFLVMAGYLRLEELTRGYYTTLLRLGAGAVVVLTVLGLFLVF